MTSFLRFGALMAAAGCAAAAAGCGSSGPTTRPATAPVVLTASQVSALRALGSGDTAFGLGVLGALCAGHQDSNAVISPVSLATGLDMAYLGARGATAAAIARVLHLAAAADERYAAEFAARSALLRSLDRPGVTFAASDRIWADPSLQTRHAYLTAVRSAQGAGLTPLPLLSRPEQSRRRINAAIARGTRGHIPHLLPPGSLARPAAGWVLTDALYLHARWQQPFNHALTAKSSFHAASGPVSASYMNGGSFATAHADGWTAVALPYRGGRLTMIAALPPAGAAGCRLPDTATVGTLAGRLGRAGRSLPCRCRG